jgi:hypothetical protein
MADGGRYFFFDARNATDASRSPGIAGRGAIPTPHAIIISVFIEAP